MDKKRIVLAGGSGFLGRALAQALLVRGYHVVLLTRAPGQGSGFEEAEWDGEHVGEWIQHLNDAEAVVNLAGRSINCPHTSENLREILESRVDSVRAIALAFSHVKTPPRVWVQAGAVGFYGNAGDRSCDESTPAGRDALAGICKGWEAAFDAVVAPKTRRALLRIGFVLGRDGGALPVLARLARWFLGGSVGGGHQYISWIHIADVTAMFIAAIEQTNLSGAFNAVGLQPVTNREFMWELRHALGRPWSPPVPEFVLRLGARLMKSEPALVLTGQRCVPARFQEAGFKFQFSNLPVALKNLCRPR